MSIFSYLNLSKSAQADVGRADQTLPKVTIVIPAYDEQDCIVQCLDSCLNQTSPPDEVLVVNNRSTDNTAKLVRSYIKEKRVRHIVRLIDQNEKQGIIPTRNKGFAEAKYDVMGRIDADCLLDKQWVAQVKTIFSDPSVAAATGPVAYHDMPAQRVGLKFDQQIRNALNKIAKDHKFLFGSNMAITKNGWAAIKETAAEDKQDLLHEDVDLALCLFEKNLKITYSSKMIGGMSARRLEDNPRDFYNYVMRFERTLRLHGIESMSSRLPIVIYLSVYFPTKVLRSIYDTKQGKFTATKIKKLLIDRIKELSV